MSSPLARVPGGVERCWKGGEVRSLHRWPWLLRAPLRASPLPHPPVARPIRKRRALPLRPRATRPPPVSATRPRTLASPPRPQPYRQCLPHAPPRPLPPVPQPPEAPGAPDPPAREQVRPLQCRRASAPPSPHRSQRRRPGNRPCAPGLPRPPPETHHHRPTRPPQPRWPAFPPPAGRRLAPARVVGCAPSAQPARQSGSPPAPPPPQRARPGAATRCPERRRPPRHPHASRRRRLPRRRMPGGALQSRPSAGARTRPLPASRRASTDPAVRHAAGRCACARCRCRSPCPACPRMWEGRRLAAVSATIRHTWRAACAGRWPRASCP
mmetsp:Transcript_34998/g.111434  ORF Transcript_34998/g.111434 Transcript_34998/m.111434 type:complete len:326 (-) Transcript_34998:432-1409(-)